MDDKTLNTADSNGSEDRTGMKVYSNDKAIKDLMETIRDYYLNDSL